MGAPLRLEHTGNFGIGDPTEVNGMINGSVMRPALWPGHHRIKCECVLRLGA